MNVENRLKNSIRNMIYSFAGQSLNLILNFISRTIFIRMLGSEYLGINGLFTNILSILSLAELGVGSAIIYSMYKPIADKNKESLKSLMNLYKKYYNIIALIIFGLGLLVIPLLPFIAKNSTVVNNLNLIYILFLLNSIISYFFSYKRSIIIADQRNYIVTLNQYSFSIIRIIIQTIILYLTKNYLLFLSIQILATFLENLSISFKANKLYPFLKERTTIRLPNNEKKLIFKNIKALIIFKVCQVILDGTDNILISIFVGLSAVGTLSNYILITGAISGILYQITNSITASVGNLVVTETNEKQEDVLKNITFFTFLLYGFCTVCLNNLLNPFIMLWLGNEYLLSNTTVLIISLNFFVIGIMNATWIYRNTKGLFVHGKFRPLISALMNIIISVVLVRKIGITGVLLGTLTTRLLTNIFYDPYVIYKHGFKKSVINYYILLTKYFLILFITGFLTWFSTNFIINTWNNFVLKFIITLFIILGTFFVTLYRTKEFKYFFSLLKAFIFREKKYNKDV